MSLFQEFQDHKPRQLARQLISAEQMQAKRHRRADRMARKIVGGGWRAAKASGRADAMRSQLDRLRAEVEANPTAFDYYQRLRKRLSRVGR